MVWLPPQYHDPAYANTRFPVVMLFPGYPGSAAGWFSVLGGGQVLGQMLAQQKATPFVLVAVNVNQNGQNLNCSNIPGGPQMATYIAQDVRTMIEANFHVSDRRTGWGLMGFSDGGLCAGKLLLGSTRSTSARRRRWPGTPPRTAARWCAPAPTSSTRTPPCGC